jgi:outer membrane protein assembly factor BamA
MSGKAQIHHALASLTLALLAGSVVACGGSRRLGTPPRSDDPATRWVRSFELVGNHTFDDDAIRAKLHYGTAKRDDDRVYRPAMLELDQQRIAAFYRERGYFSARAQAQMIRRTPGFVDIRVLIEEGLPTRIMTLAARGVPDRIDALAVAQRAGLKRDDIFVHERYLAARDGLRDTLDRNGYIHARVEGVVRVDRDRHTAEVEFHVDPGPQVRFGEVIITGNQRIPASAIATRVAWSRGQVFDADKLRQTRKALFELDMFRTVRIDYDRAARSPVADVTIEVREGERREIKLGGGLGVEGAGGLLERGLVQYSDTRLELRGRGELTVRSFVDPLLTVRLGVRPGYVLLPGANEEHNFVFEARADANRPDFLWRRLVLGTFVSYSVQRFEAYSEQGPRAGVLLDRSFWDDRLHAGVGAQGAYSTLTPSEGVELADLGTDGPVGVSFVHQSLKIDRRDDRVHTHSGWFAELRLEQGRWFADASGLYARNLADVRGYLPMTSRLVLAARTRGGLLSSTVSGDEPITQRLFSGGSNHRGFGVRRLAPVVLDDRGITVPVGGAALVEASLELRADVVKLSDAWLGGVLFVDTGDVVATPGELDPLNLHVAVGGGLRYETPIGPIRFDVGVRLNRLRACQDEPCLDPDPGRQMVFHFSVGEAF